MEQYELLLSKFIDLNTVSNRAYAGLLPKEVGDKLMSLNGEYIPPVSDLYWFIDDLIVSGDLVPTESVSVYAGSNLAVVFSQQHEIIE